MVQKKIVKVTVNIKIKNSENNEISICPGYLSFQKNVHDAIKKGQIKLLNSRRHFCLSYSGAKLYIQINDIVNTYDQCLKYA